MKNSLVVKLQKRSLPKRKSVLTRVITVASKILRIHSPRVRSTKISSTRAIWIITTTPCLANRVLMKQVRRLGSAPLSLTKTFYLHIAAQIFQVVHRSPLLIFKTHLLAPLEKFKNSFRTYAIPVSICTVLV